MKKVIYPIDPFTCLFPTLDLHGLNSFEAEVKIKEFINDNIKLKNESVCIIHGKGSGILREVMIKLLNRDKRVIEHKLDNTNDGMTIVKLDLKI